MKIPDYVMPLPTFLLLLTVLSLPTSPTPQSQINQLATTIMPTSMPTLSLLVVPVYFSGIPVGCLVDSGSVQTVIDTSTFARLEKVARITNMQANYVGLGGQSWQESRLYDIPNVGIEGAFGWNWVRIAVARDGWLPGHCILGSDVLSRQPVVLDYARGEIRPLP